MGKYSIWVLDYAAVNQFPQSVMLYGPQYVGIRNLPYAYVLIKGQGQVILVDNRLRPQRIRQVSRRSLWRLELAFGIRSSRGMRRPPADVTTVLITPRSFRSHGRARSLSQRKVSIFRSAKSISGCGRLRLDRIPLSGRRRRPGRHRQGDAAGARGSHDRGRRRP